MEDTLQLGACPNRRAISAVLLKVVTCDLIRQIKFSAALCNNDAVCTYDCMLAVLAAISGRRLGLPELAAKLHLAILRMMRFFVRTACGASPGFYGNAECLSFDLPGPGGSNSNLTAWFGNTVTRAYGVLQGLSNGPLYWNSVHLPAFQTLDTLTPGLEIQSADNSLIQPGKGEVFADDTDLWVSDNTTTCIGLTPPEGLQQLAQHWHRVLRCTGGGLGLHKCFWTFVEFEWGNGRASYVAIADSPHTALLRTNDSAYLPPTPVTRKEPHDSLRMLGAHVAPDGNHTTEEPTDDVAP
jgi:hypothetical protein